MRSILILMLSCCFASAGLQAQGRSIPLAALSSKDKVSKPKQTALKVQTRSAVISQRDKPEIVEKKEVKEAYNALDAGNLEVAIDVFDDYAASDYDAAFGLGVAFFEDNQPVKAKKYLKMAADLEPDDTDALFFLGLCYSDEGAFAEAEKVFLKILSMDPEDAYTWDELGWLYFLSGNTDQANYCKENVLSIDSEYITSY